MPKSIPVTEPVVEVTPVASEPIAAAALTPEALRVLTDRVVMKGTYASVGVGFIPFPIIDIIAVSGFQLKMISELSELHGVKFSEHIVRNVITALIGSLGPIIVGQYATRTLLKFIPGVGTAIAGLWVQGAIDGATTYAIGRTFQQHFERGGTIFDFDIVKAKDYFVVKFQEGKTIVAKSVSNAGAAAANTFTSKEKVTTVPVTVVETVPA